MLSLDGMNTMIFKHIRKKNSEPAKHLLENFGHSFNWSVIFNAPNNIRERKNSEASFIRINETPAK